MGTFFITLFKRITLLNSILMIIYCFFHPKFGEFDLMLIVVLLLLVSWIIWLIGKTLNFIFKNKYLEDKKLKTNSMFRGAYFQFCENIELMYSVFWALYVLFHHKQIGYAYLILLMFGLYIGNRIAINANRYLLDQARKRQKK